MKEKASYCEAHERCYQSGLDKNRIGYMVGETYVDLFRDRSPASDMWINFHCLLHSMCFINEKKWISGERASKFDGNMLAVGKFPKIDGFHRLALFTKGKAIKTTGTWNNKLVYGCEFAAEIIRKSGIRRGMFVSDVKDFNNLHPDNDRTEGCYKIETGFTLISCAMK